MNNFISLIIKFVLIVLLTISFWKLFKKAGKKGWEAIIPIYNILILLEILNLPKWYILLLLTIPTSIYLIFKGSIELAHKYGKTTFFGVLTVFLSFICIPMLAFDKQAVYHSNNTYDDEYNF